MFLRLEDSSGKAVTIEVTGPGGVCRASVGEPGRRSGIWRIWANRSTADVYVAARNIVGVQKYSLHQSGDWRLQWSSTQAATAFGEPSSDRVIDQWPRPAGIGVGWTRGLSIQVPHGELSDIPGDPKDDAVTWIPEPGEGRVAGIEVMVVKPDLGYLPVAGPIPIDAFTLVTGEAVVVLRSDTELGDDAVVTLGDARGRAEALLRQRPELLTPSTEGLRMSLAGRQADGHRFVWDLKAPDGSAMRT